VSGPNFGEWLCRSAIIPLAGNYVRTSAESQYVDRDGVLWVVPPGFRFNGASIPRAFWSIVGHPLQAEFVHAAGLHDLECERREHPWQEVHRRFYWALRASGVGWRRAETMWTAVRLKGPRW
jgi:hypothetical protein